MVSAIVDPLRRGLATAFAATAPAEIAAGCVLGMTIGLVPKCNLIALSLCVALFSLRCHRGIALMAAVAFCMVTPWTDPFAHKLGEHLLHVPTLQVTYASVLCLPAGPWIGFNNTVVAGSLVIAAYLAYPVYWCVKALLAACTRSSTV